MSIGNVRVTFTGLEDADAGRLAADLVSVVDAQAPGATATRVRTDPTSMDLGTSLLITFVAESAVILCFKLIEKYMERRAKSAHFTIELSGEGSEELVKELARCVDKKNFSSALAAEVEKYTRPTA